VENGELKMKNENNSQFSTLNSPLIPPGYKQTEVGVIPEDWETQPLGAGIKLVSGHHVLARHCNTDGDGVPYITGPADFPNGVIQHTKFTTKPGTICRARDVLVTVKGSGAGTLVLAYADYCISRQLMAIRVEAWDTSYIYFSLLRDVTLFGAAATGLIPGLSRGDILNKVIPLPSTKAEQQAIAEALSDADALIESLEQLITKKRHLKQGAMQELLTGKRRLLGFVNPTVGYKQTDVGVIPEDWDCKTIDKVGFVTSGKRLPLGSSLTERQTPHPYIRVTDMRPGTVSLSDIKFVPEEIFPVIKRYRISRDDIFISVAGTLGIVGKVPKELDGANLTENADRITNIICSQEYLLHVLMSPLIQSTIESLQTVGAQPKLALTRIRKFAIPLPPTKAEQEAIAEVLSDMDAEISALEAKLAKTRQLKQGMMHNLLTGKIRLI
jgi:type I restriction enzyme, S subunit